LSSQLTNEREILARAPPPADLRIAYGAAASQFGDLRLPHGEGPHPVAIVIHGGFWRAQYDLLHIGHLCAALTEAGIATWSLEFRRVGEPGGGWPGTLQDVALGSAHLSQIAQAHNLDVQRVVTVGHSAGGHLALWLAAHSRKPIEDVDAQRLGFELCGAVSLAGVVDLKRAAALGLGNRAAEALLGGTPDAVPERFDAASPREHLPLGVPHVLIHGQDDDIVPVDLARAYFTAASHCGDQVHLHALPSTGHFAVIDPLSRAWPVVESALRALVFPA
jgi:acetyl esterase/lipase